MHLPAARPGQSAAAASQVLDTSPVSRRFWPVYCAVYRMLVSVALSIWPWPKFI